MKSSCFVADVEPVLLLQEAPSLIRFFDAVSKRRTWSHFIFSWGVEVSAPICLWGRGSCDEKRTLIAVLDYIYPAARSFHLESQLGIRLAGVPRRIGSDLKIRSRSHRFEDGNN
jgi:hypothetical protein